MNERPLLADISSHQTYLDLEKAKAAGNDVLGIVMRASVGILEDVDFDVFDDYYDWDKLYRGSYHALWPMYNVPTQVDIWHRKDPNGYVYMEDIEVTNNMEPELIANKIIKMSDMMLEKTGKRPWMYGAYWFLMINLIPFASEEWLNEHWWVLAQWDLDDGKEYEGINLPDKIHIDRVAFKQTSGRLELYPGSGAVDRDRFLLGGVEELEDFMAEYTGVEPPVIPPTNCCEELEIWLDEIESRTEILAANAIVRDNRLNVNDVNIATNASNIVTLDKVVTKNETAVSDNANKIDSLESLVKTCGEGIGELEAQAIFWDLNIEQHNKLVDMVTDLKEQVDTSVDMVAHNNLVKRVHELELGVMPECNHSHRKIFSWLFNRK